MSDLFLFNRLDRQVQIAIIKQSMTIVPFSSTGSVFNAILSIAIMFRAPHIILTIPFLVGTIVVNWLRFVQAKQTIHKEDEIIFPSLIEAKICKYAFVSGFLWWYMILVAGIFTSGTSFGALCMLGGGVLGGVVISYGVLPRAGLAFMLPIGLGGIALWIMHWSVLTTPAILMIVSFIMLLTRTTINNERILVAKILGEISLKKNIQTVQLLLKEYETQSSDWLWALDQFGCVEKPSFRFMEVSQRTMTELTGCYFLILFDNGPEKNLLRELLQKHEGFRDLTLPLTIQGSIHWWSLSAQPKLEGGMNGVASDVTVQKLAEKRIYYMAHFDELTGLANRFLFNEILFKALEELTPDQQIAILYIDLDNFKSINDTFGHVVGDKLLCQSAQRIHNCFTEDTQVARLGGDKFAVLFRQVASITEIQACAQYIINAVTEPLLIAGVELRASASIGIAMASEHHRELDEIDKNADFALFCAKQAGGKRFVTFMPGMAGAVHERRELEQDIISALSHGEFELYYQPIIALRTGMVASYEALIRWNHPRRGLVTPAMFIDIAEKTGFVVQLGEWVIREAVQALTRWHSSIGVSVNLSPNQIYSPTLITTITNAINQSGVDAKRVQLEITETILLQDNNEALSILREIKHIGVIFALDDFGTGYSSLNYLRRFPIDKVKIDRCFIEEIINQSDSQIIVQAIIDLAKKLGITTVIEGIETKDQLNFVLEKGADEAQGYYFSEPCPIDQLLHGQCHNIKSINEYFK